MTLWFRVDAGAVDDTRIGELALALKVRRNEAFGLVVAVWCGHAHQPQAKLAQFDDAQLEGWARWHGRRGKFASAFRALFQEADGSLRGWWRQAKLIERMERDRTRRNSVEISEETSADISVEKSPLQDNTEQDKVDSLLLATRALVGKLNLGQADNPNLDQVRLRVVPLHDARSQQATADILAAGVAMDFAEREVYEAARGYRPSGLNKQIGGLGYLKARVISAWERTQAQSALKSTDRPKPAGIFTLAAQELIDRAS